MRDAEGSLHDAQSRYNDMLAEQALRTDQVAKATQSLADTETTLGFVQQRINLEDAAPKITATNDAESLALAVLGEDHRPAPDPLTLAEAVLNILDTVAGGHRADGSSYAGLWSDLDREGVNRLVRVLRRARDAAFGRDE